MIEVHGFCAPGWEGVQDAFTANIESGGEIGAAYAVDHDGRLVVDLMQTAPGPGGTSVRFQVPIGTVHP